MIQENTPLADALLKQVKDNYVAFDVPGHKSNHDDLIDFFGEKCVLLDKNSRESIDYLCQPRGVILEAEKLAAEAFGAKDAFFMVGGTTSSVQAMIMCVCTPGDKIILPRNVHYSVINAVILAGAVPVYVEPPVHSTLGIALGMRVEDLEHCIRQNTDAKAVLVNNPTYYGICSDIKSIIELAHSYQMYVLADEAHGTHFYFSDQLPEASIQSGADLAAVSIHKTGGSFTQTSILLSSGTIEKESVSETINLMCTTSASYLLMASLDIARKNLVLNGEQKLAETIALAEKTRNEINKLNGFYAFGKEIIDNDTVYDFDLTKLSINSFGTGLTGIEVYAMLRDRHNIQLEFGDMRNFLAVCSMFDTKNDHHKLLNALKTISEQCKGCGTDIPCYEYIPPIVKLSPRKAFYSRKTVIPVTEAKNRISGCAVMSYPPGIPLLAPGELITQKIIEHIVFAANKGCSVSGLDKQMNISVID